MILDFKSTKYSPVLKKRLTIFILYMNILLQVHIPVLQALTVFQSEA